MTRMNRKLEYALMALKHMSLKVPGQLTSAKEVVSTTGVPFDATARVMQQMAQQGLLRAEHGAHGGYSIVKDLSKVSFFDLHEMILGPLDIVKCIQATTECDLSNTCNIQSPLTNLSRRLSDFYRGVTLAELLRIKETTRVSNMSAEAGPQ